MGFEMSNDGGGASSTGGGNGGSGVNAYGAAPPPAPPGGLLVPNALGGQAQPVIVSDAGDGAALASPDALASSVDTKGTYARVYVTGSNTDTISHTSRFGAVPSNASPAEPTDLTKPGSLGYLSPTAGTAESTSAEGKPRTDKLFDSFSGIYSYTNRQHFTRAEGDLGVRAGGDIIIAAGVGQTDTNSGGVGKDLDLSAIGDIRLWAGGKVKQYANGDSENYYHGQRYTTVVGTNKTTVHGSSGSTTYGDATSEIYGFQKSYVYGYSLATLYGLRTTFNFAGTSTTTIGAVLNLNVSVSCVINLSYRFNLNAGGVWNHTMGTNVSTNYGATMSTTLGIATNVITGGRMTTINGNDLKNVFGLDAKIVDFSFDIKLQEFKTLNTSMTTTLTARLNVDQVKAETEAMSAKISQMAMFL
jgi:hypothetical protein